MISHRLCLLTFAALGVALAGCPTVPEECRSDVDCPSGEGCREELCVPIEDTEPDAGLPPASDAGEADAGPTEPDAGPDEPDAGEGEPDDAGSDEDDAGTDAGA